MSKVSDAFLRVHQELAAAQEVYLHACGSAGLANAPRLQTELFLLAHLAEDLLKRSRDALGRINKLQHGHDEDT